MRTNKFSINLSRAFLLLLATLLAGLAFSAPARGEFAPLWTSRVPAGKVIKELAPIVGGKGGGKADMAEGGGNQPENLPAALEKSYEVVERLLS